MYDPPHSPDDLLRNLNLAFNAGTFLRRESFAEAAMFSITGAEVVEFECERPNWMTAFAKGFHAVTPQDATSQNEDSLMQVRIRRVELAGGGTSAHISFSTTKPLPELRFSEVTAIIGQDWTRKQKFIRNLHKRPPATQPMGNTHIAYRRLHGDIASVIEIRFWHDATLKDAVWSYDIERAG